jgi:predicted nuclease of predicted toxin-antitoxin system
MANPPPPLYLDEDVSVVVAAILRARGFEAMTARDSGQLGRSDFDQLIFAAKVGCVLLTHNRVDFERLHREWFQNGRPHKGIIIARRRSPAELAARLGQLLGRLPTDELPNQLLYI